MGRHVDVAGSSPATGCQKCCPHHVWRPVVHRRRARDARLCGRVVMHRSCKPDYAGSTPAGGSMVKCRNCKTEYVPCRSSYGYYCSNQCQCDFVYEKWAIKVRRTGVFTSTIGMRRPKKFLREKQGDKCRICGRKTWNGKPILLVFDHINGNHRDNRVTNCRMICSNCDAQLTTYKNRNRGQGRHSRRMRYRQGKSY